MRAFLHPDDQGRARRLFEGALAGTREYQDEQRLVGADGVVRWVFTKGRVVRDAAGRPVRMVGVCSDITERKRAEQELRRAKEEAEAANRAKDRFLAVLSHELRTPLTPVMMAVGALEQDPALPAPARADLAMIKRNLELETRLIDDLLDLSRVVNGKMRLELKSTEVHTLVDNVLNLFRASIEAKRLSCRRELSAEDDRVSADPARLQQVLWNLLSNAVKFTPEGGRVAVRTTNPEPGVLCVEVADSGAGIDAGVLPRLFNAFEQGEQAVTRRFGGLGLGLAISRAVVEMHGGTIRAESAGKDRGAASRSDSAPSASSP